MQVIIIKNKQDDESYIKDFTSIDEGKTWVINHLDLSKGWEVEKDVIGNNEDGNIIRCNDCYNIYEEDIDNTIIECEDCKTDSYLMELKESEE